MSRRLSRRSVYSIVITPLVMRRRHRRRRSVWQMLGLSLCVSIVGTCIPRGPCDAQNGYWVQTNLNGKFWLAPQLKSMPLTVRPDTMTLGTENPKAGEYHVGEDSMVLAYVPKACEGTRRCPLAVVLHDDVQPLKTVITIWRPVAETYGLIVLAPWKGHWTLEDEPHAHDVVDSAMTWVLTTFAIDPARIALVAHWSSGRAAMGLGGYRLDLFSRVVLATTDYLVTNVDPHNHTTQFLLTECANNGRAILKRMQALEHDGHPAHAFVGFRLLRGGAEDHEWEVIGKWLRQSWATPSPQPEPPPAAKTVPLLTPEAIQKMDAFWTKFASEPDSIRFWVQQHEVALWVPGTHLSVLMVDMPALAQHYPSVAADLNAVGLTAEAHDAYRAAITSVLIIRDARDSTGDKVLPPALARQVTGSNPSLAIEPGSVTEKNIDFVKQNWKLVRTMATSWFKK